MARTEVSAICHQRGLNASNPNQGQDVPAWLSLILAAHRVPRITVVVIRSAPNAACLSADTTMSQARTS